VRANPDKSTASTDRLIELLAVPDNMDRSHWNSESGWHLSETRTGWAKKRGHRLMTIILSIPNRLRKFFTGRFLGKFAVNCILKIPLHLAHVATLPCETLMSAKQAIHDKLQGSVATYVFKFKVWYSC